MHKLLKRQIEKYFNKPVRSSDSVEKFFDVISQTYEGFDSDRVLMERSLDISSQELRETNLKLKKESDRQKIILDKLKLAVSRLSSYHGLDQSGVTHKDDAAYLTDVIVDLINFRKKAEGELIQQKALLDNVISNIPYFVFWKNRKCVYQGCNHNFARVAGVGKPENIVGKTDYDLAWKKEEADFFIQIDTSVMDSGAAILNIEEPQLQADGKKAILLTSKVPLLNEKGNVDGILGIYLDITDRKNIEEALLKSETMHRAFIENLPDIFTEVSIFKQNLKPHEKEKVLTAIRKIEKAPDDNLDTVITKALPDLLPYQENRFTYVNRKGKSVVFGSELAEYAKTTLFDIIDKADKESIIKAFTKIFKYKVVPNIRHSVITMSGDRFILSTNATLTKKEFPFMVECVSRDITRQCEVEKELERHRLYLEKLVDERTKKLSVAMDELEKAKNMAEEANKMKSQFFFGISHELRTPLNCIIGFAEMILDADKETAKNHASVILRQSETLLTLINQVLDHAKLESGKVELEILPVDIHRLLNDVIENYFRHQAAHKGLKLYFSCSNTVPRFIMADELKIRQILINLLSNAVKFTEKGHIKVSVCMINAMGKNLLKFSVADSGIGIAKEKQRRIFESFTQEDNSTTRRYGGTGLGTTIAMSLVRLMKGDIGLKSIKGKGSTFWFSIPVTMATVTDFVEGENAKKRSSAAITNKHYADNKAILLADDYPPNQELIKLQLENAGYKVSVAGNGKKALELFKKKDFDLVVMDVQMPEMDGYEATRKIRALKKSTSDVPIIGLTAHTDPKAREECIKSGMTDVVLKPVERLSFLSVVSSYISNKKNKKSNKKYKRQEGTVNDESMPLDFNEAISEFGGNRELYVKALKLFMELIPGQVGSIKEAAKNGDMEALGKEAHKIKGGAANMRAKTMAFISEGLEKAAKSNDKNAVKSNVTALENELARLEDFVNEQGLLKK